MSKIRLDRERLQAIRSDVGAKARDVQRKTRRGFQLGTVMVFFIGLGLFWGVVSATGGLAASAEAKGAEVVSTTTPALATEVPQTSACPLPEKPTGAAGDLLIKWERTRSFCAVIVKAAEESGLDPLLIAAVIWQESGGNPEAISKSGAVGLMQVMPRDGIAADHQCINGPCFADRPTTEELKDPEFNVNFGTAFLGGKIASEGSVREGLFRYGPENVGYYYADIILGLYERLK